MVKKKKRPTDNDVTVYPCYGDPKPIILSWSRLKEWKKCKQRSKLLSEHKTSSTNARNFLMGNLVDHCMREALENAARDPEGRMLSISMDELLSPLPTKWAEEIKPNVEAGRYVKWNTPDPREDQEFVLGTVVDALEKLHPILEDNIVGHRFMPEFRPKDGMPIVGIPGPNDEQCYIRLFLAVDCAVQLVEDPPDGVGGWGLFDLKTTSSMDYLKDTLPQLVFYDIAFHALTGKRPIKHALWAPLVDDPIVSIDVTDEDRIEIMKWIISYVHSVWANETELTEDTNNCYNCITRQSCPRFLTPTSKDERGISRVYFGQEGGKLHG